MWSVVGKALTPALQFSLTFFFDLDGEVLPEVSWSLSSLTFTPLAVEPEAAC